MNYAAFKDYLARFVWRDGDAPFEAELDNLIQMGEARLNRDLRIQRMVEHADLAAVDGSAPLPSGYREIITVYTAGRPSPLAFVSAYEMERLRATDPRALLGRYTISGNALRVAGPVSDTIKISYYAEVPDFQTEDASWLADEYLDLYTYAVLRHTASYLRDDDRVALWQNEYAETLASVMDDETKRRYAGSPLTMPLPGIVA